eukprot:TRINITY_DN1758_c0_g1_i1.p1 TRINITY_DN1758_c0_g1~~TRINITY_DN1758_c0_g1_i1.p1  ORF type:complete len:333 (-),score=101.54 TRINITY_DN1758_c0_g1_i1:29-1027(-)
MCIRDRYQRRVREQQQTDMGRCKHINGDIWIQTDKPAYYAGELVEGTVFLTVREPIQCHGVQVKASGKEKVEWTEQRSRQVRDGEDDQGNPRFRTEHYEVEFDEKEKFFKDWIDVWRAPGATIPAGQWSYRWQYQLPAGLPGSIDYHSHNEGWLVKSKAYIKYKFKATLDAAWKKDLKEEQEIIVYQQQQQAVQAQADSKIENIYCCCCFPKGKAGLSVVMDKNTYMPGDTAQILADIDMSESKAELSKMNVSLIRTIELKADGHFKQLQHLSLIHISEPTRLLSISYAVFCLKKKKKTIKKHIPATYKTRYITTYKHMYLNYIPYTLSIFS